MLRRTLIVSLVAFTSFLACKARRGDVSAVKADEAPTQDGSSPKLDEVLAYFERDMTDVEQTYLVAGGGEPSQVEGLALAGGIPNAAILAQGIRDTAARLRTIATESPEDKRDEVTKVALELEVMAIFVATDMPGADLAAINANLARAQAILDHPPKPGDDAGEGKPTPKPDIQPVTRPEPIKQPEINYDNVECATFGPGRYLPRVVQTGEFIGLLGFQQVNNCQQVAANVRSGLVCSISVRDRVSPYYTRTKSMLGPALGFLQTANCLKAVRAATDTICLVDNSQGNDNPSFAKFDIASGRAVGGWYHSHEKCLANDKSKDARTVCMERCQAKAELCKQRAALITNKSDATFARIDCNLDHIKCMQEGC